MQMHPEPRPIIYILLLRALNSAPLALLLALVGIGVLVHDLRQMLAEWGWLLGLIVLREITAVIELIPRTLRWSLHTIDRLIVWRPSLERVVTNIEGTLAV